MISVKTAKLCHQDREFIWWTWFINTLRPRRTRQHFTHNIFKRNLFNENVWISIKILLKFVPKSPINNIPALVQIMAWRRPGDKPLSVPMMVSLPTHICVTRPQWVNFYTVQPKPCTLWNHDNIHPQNAITFNIQFTKKIPQHCVSWWLVAVMLKSTRSSAITMLYSRRIFVSLPPQELKDMQSLNRKYENERKGR